MTAPKHATEKEPANKFVAAQNQAMDKRFPFHFTSHYSNLYCAHPYAGQCCDFFCSSLSARNHLEIQTHFYFCSPMILNAHFRNAFRLTVSPTFDAQREKLLPIAEQTLRHRTRMPKTTERKKNCVQKWNG